MVGGLTDAPVADDFLAGRSGCTTRCGRVCRRTARAWADVTSEEVEHAIRAGVHFLKARQAPDGSWPDVDPASRTGTTSLIVLALMTAGEKPGSPAIQAALQFLRQFRPEELNSTYAISLQTMVFAAAEPNRDKNRILANVEVLELSQIKLGERNTMWPGTWNYHIPNRPGDNSNTQYALLGLNAAREAGVTIRPEVLAAVAGVLRALSEPRRGLELYAAGETVDRKYDVRGDLEPDSDGVATVRESRVSPGRAPFTTAARADSTPT